MLLKHSVQQISILNALPPQLALLDKDGNVFAVNDSWKKYGKQNGIETGERWTHYNYINVSQNATGEDAYYGKRIARNIKKVMQVYKINKSNK